MAAGTRGGALCLLLLAAGCHVAASLRTARARSLSIEGPNFVLSQGGAKHHVQIRGGEIHYFRVPEVHWRDRLLRAQAMGLNAVSTYVPWNWHEEREGAFDFTSERRDLVKFLKLADELGLLVILRAGPYICAEWEFGGLPAWLLKYTIRDGLKFRSSDPRYLHFVERWWSALLPRIQPLLLEAGGPVAMVQLENEFGHFGDAGHDDLVYFDTMERLARRFLGNNVLLITADSAWNNHNGTGTRPSLFAGVDLGPWFEAKHHLAQVFNASNPHNHGGPELLMELWTGWFQTWGKSSFTEGHFRQPGKSLVGYVEELMHRGASFNLYMAHGGSNFGFWNAATVPEPTSMGYTWSSVIGSSYDYAAPISEAGLHGLGGDGLDKYAALQRLLLPSRGAWEPPLRAEPAPPVLLDYGRVALRRRVALRDPAVLRQLCSWGVERTKRPRPMEFHGQQGGLALYRFRIPADRLAALATNATAGSFLATEEQQSPLWLRVRDRVTVWSGRKLLQQARNTMLYGPKGRLQVDTVHIPVTGEDAGDLDILVEHLGRSAFVKRRVLGIEAESYEDWKGLIHAKLGADELVGEWQYCGLPLSSLPAAGVPASSLSEEAKGPSFFQGSFAVQGEPADTFLRLDAGRWQTGTAFVNGFNLGRFLRGSRGPFDFYVPKSALRQGNNEVVILEMDPPSDMKLDDAAVTFTATRGSMLPEEPAAM